MARLDGLSSVAAAIRPPPYNEEQDMSITEQNTIQADEPSEIAVAAKPRRRDKSESKEAPETSTAATPVTKAELVLKKLRAPRGVTVQGLMEATGWQAHSVRGFLSGTVRKKLGFNVLSEIGKDGARRYRISTRA